MWYTALIPPKQNKRGSKSISQIKMSQKNTPVEQKSSLLTPIVSALMSSCGVMLASNKSVEVKTDGQDKCAVDSYYVDIPKPLQGVMASVFSTNKSYRFRLIRTATLVTSGGGTMNLATLVHPSQFDQYSALALLFNQSRLRSTRITYIGNIAPAATTVVQQPFVSAFDPSYSSFVTPSHTFTTANRLPKSKNFSLIMSKWPVTNSYRSPNRPWSYIAATGSGSDPVGGVEGAWIHCISGTASASATYLQYVIVADYEFRNVH